MRGLRHAPTKLGSLAIPLTLALAGFAAAQSLSGDTALTPPPLAQAPSTDVQAITRALTAARSGDAARAATILATTTDPLARRIALWMLADAEPEALTWAQADEARRELADWPRPSRREMAAEKLLDLSGLSPEGVIAWFGGADPVTGEGAMSLANAYLADGQTSAAAAVIRKAWRTLVFSQAVQSAMLARFSDLIAPSDIAERADLLLYGDHEAAALDLVQRLPPDRQAVAMARLALRRGDRNAEAMVAALPPADQTSPGVIYERLLAMQARGDIPGALSLVGYMPASLPYDGAAEKLWRHGRLVVGALEAGDPQRAYMAAAHSGLGSGPQAAEAQFYAGWIALTRLKDPKLAASHFAAIEGLSPSPITQARAFYWRGRAVEAQGDFVDAQLFYGQAARFPTTFYGQLAAAREGQKDLVLGHDPQLTAADRTAFESRDSIRAARMMAAIGATDSFRSFVSGLSETMPDAQSAAQLVDLALSQGDQMLAMRVVRNVARRGIILPDRGYPILTPPAGVMASAEAPLVLGVTRQESSFDPSARSGAGARGLMQLMPATAEIVARRNGLGWGRLDDPDFNLRVGSAYLGQLVEEFGGSYVLAAAAYNAGPHRPAQWTAICGDPRSGSTDPTDFIECIPFSETRDYVMRVLEAMQVYRARLAGGSAPLTLAADLKRGGWGYRILPPNSPAITQAAPAAVELPPVQRVGGR